MGRLSRSFVYAGCRRLIEQKYGKAASLVIWKEAEDTLRMLSKQHAGAGSDEKMMVLPLFALYQALKKHDLENALPLLMEYGQQTGERLSRLIRKCTSIPGVPALLWRNMPALMRTTSSPKKGYERRIISETSDLVGVDILTCPLVEMAKGLGAPEIAAVVCRIDKGQMSGFRSIVYTRTKALGEGDKLCDYRLRFDKTKR